MVHVLIVTTAHVPGDQRVQEKFAEAFLDAECRVTWIGPRTHRTTTSTKVKINYKLTHPNRRRTDRFMHYPELLRKALETESIDWIYAPDPDSWIFALVLARLKCAKVVLDIHEAYDLVHLKTWLPPFAYQPGKRLMQFVIRYTLASGDVVVGVTDEILERFAPNHAMKFVILNSPLAGAIKNIPNQVNAERAKKPRVMQGKFGASRGTPFACEAISLLASHGQFPSLVGVDNGETRPGLGEACSHLIADDQIECHTYMDYASMLQLTAGCDVGLIDPSTSAIPALPNRLFEFMALGIPVLVPEEAKGMADLVQRYRCGLTYTLKSPKSLAEGIHNLTINSSLWTEMSKNGQRAFQSHLSFESQLAPLLSRVLLTLK